MSKVFEWSKQKKSSYGKRELKLFLIINFSKITNLIGSKININLHNFIDPKLYRVANSTDRNNKFHTIIFIQEYLKKNLIIYLTFDF